MGNITSFSHSGKRTSQSECTMRGILVSNYKLSNYPKTKQTNKRQQQQLQVLTQELYSSISVALARWTISSQCHFRVWIPVYCLKELSVRRQKSHNNNRNECCQVFSLDNNSFCLANLIQYLYQEHVHSKDEHTEVWSPITWLALEPTGALATFKTFFVLTGCLHLPQFLKQSALWWVLI